MQFGHGTQSDDVTNRPEALSLSAIVCSVAGLQVHCTLPLYTATLQPPSRQLAPISLLLLLLHLLPLFLHPLPFSRPSRSPLNSNDQDAIRRPLISGYSFRSRDRKREIFRPRVPESKLKCQKQRAPCMNAILKVKSLVRSEV